MDDGISFEAKMGDGSQADNGMLGKLMGAGKRALSGESIFMTHFTNGGSGKKRVSFAAPYPGKIVPINLRKVGGEILCQKDPEKQSSSGGYRLFGGLYPGNSI